VNASNLDLSAALLASNLEQVRRRVGAAAQRAGRDPAEVTLIAVTKTVSPAVAARLVVCGQQVLAENRVDKFLEKHAAIPEAQIHLIGSLQTNKVRFVVGQTPLIHSIDSRRLLEKVQARAAALGIIQPVLLEVNVSGEDSKHGLTPDEARDLACAVATDDLHSPNILINGLMTMAPFDHAEAVRWVFRDLKGLRDTLRESLRLAPCSARVSMCELSMGMSNDFEVAIEEGATLIRVGTALFKETE